MEQQRKDDFLSMASHELKTPITTLRAFLQLFSSSDGPEVIVPKKHLKKMADQVDRLTRLVGDLLEVSKIQRGQIEFADEPIEIETLVHEVVASARGGHTTHHFLLQGSVDAKVRGDRARLGQALTELLNNAVKFSPGSDHIEVNLSTTDDMVHVVVRDHGIGMNAEDQERIFERYYRVLTDPTRPFPGLGVGLYIVSEIIRHHHGSIAVSSLPGEGSAFTLALPLVKEGSRNNSGNLNDQ